MFVGLLSVHKIVSFGKSLAPICKEPIKCVSLNNQSCQAKSRIVNIHSDKTFFFIDLLLALINVERIVILLMIHILEFVLQIR